MSAGNKTYGLISGILIFLILSGFISLASAVETSGLQWNKGVLNKIQRGEVITYKGYSVEAIAFPPPVESDKYKGIPIEPVEAYVGLNISKNGSLINTTILRSAESYITPDGELKITAKELPTQYAREWLFESYSPWATIELNPRGTPYLEILINTDKSEYTSSDNTEIAATIRLENKGLADAVNVNMNIETELPVKNGDLKRHFEKIKKGESITETITFISPVLTEKKMYRIFANVSGYDVMNISSTANSLKTISIAVNPQWSISLRKSAQDKMYLKDSTMISLSLKNNGKYDLKNVSIEDSLPSGFKLMSNTSLHWVADIPAGREWEYRYLVKPEVQNINGVMFPVATAEFKIKNELFGVRSNQLKIVVYGPQVVLNKKTDISEIKPGDTVTVTVVAENNGSTPTKVIIRDQLPENATLTSGSTAYEAFLEANKEASFNYTLKIDSKQTIKLPASTAEYYELGNKGEKINTESNEFEIQIKSPGVNSTDVLTPQNSTPAQIPVTPVIESSNSTPSGTVNGIDEPMSVEPSGEVDNLLNLILGCNDGNINDMNDINDSLPDSTYNACKFFRQNNKKL